MKWLGSLKDGAERAGEGQKLDTCAGICYPYLNHT